MGRIVCCNVWMLLKNGESQIEIITCSPFGHLTFTFSFSPHHSSINSSSTQSYTAQAYDGFVNRKPSIPARAQSFLLSKGAASFLLNFSSCSCLHHEDPLFLSCTYLSFSYYYFCLPLIAMDRSREIDNLLRELEGYRHCRTSAPAPTVAGFQNRAASLNSSYQSYQPSPFFHQDSTYDSPFSDANDLSGAVNEFSSTRTAHQSRSWSSDRAVQSLPSNSRYSAIQPRHLLSIGSGARIPDVSGSGPIDAKSVAASARNQPDEFEEDDFDLNDIPLDTFGKFKYLIFEDFLFISISRYGTLVTTGCGSPLSSPEWTSTPQPTTKINSKLPSRIEPPNYNRGISLFLFLFQV
jgi:hypothetical protein